MKALAPSKRESATEHGRVENWKDPDQRPNVAQRFETRCRENHTKLEQPQPFQPDRGKTPGHVQFHHDIETSSRLATKSSLHFRHTCQPHLSTPIHSSCPAARAAARCRWESRSAPSTTRLSTTPLRGVTGSKDLRPPANSGRQAPLKPFLAFWRVV